MLSAPRFCHDLLRNQIQERNKALERDEKADFALPADQQKLLLHSLSVSARLVIVVIASDVNGFRFPSECATAWRKFAEHAQGLVAFAVLIERDGFLDDKDQSCAKMNRDFFLPFCFRHSIKTFWGTFSMVFAELAAYRFACKQFPNATHFCVVSGDSVPTKTAHYYLQSNESILGFMRRSKCDDQMIRPHMIWKLLLRQHVSILLEQRLEIWTSHEKRYKELLQKDGCCKWFPDEYVIGAVLQQHCDEIAKQPRCETIMFQDCSVSTRPCGARVNNAKTYNCTVKKFQERLDKAIADPSAYAFRKARDVDISFQNDAVQLVVKK